jgi:glycosyltransferase involved in cell wall biosynthesis
MRNTIRTIAYVGNADGGVAETLREYGYRLEGIRAESALGLLRALHKMRPAVVHAQQHHLKAAGISKLLGIPLLLQAGREDVTRATARASRLAERTICAGAAVRESLLKLGAHSSSTVVMRSLVDLQGKDAAAFPPMLDPNTRWVVAASPCDGPARGHQDLLLAFLALARSRPKLKLLLAGEGCEAETLRAQAEASGMRNRVVIHAVAACQLPSIFAHAAVVVAPSRAGNSPDPVPEALAVGAAVIATGIGPHPVWIREGRTGWLVPPRSPAALSHRLAQVLDDTQLARRVGNAAHKAAAEAASPRSMAQELARCYAVIARSPSSSSRVSTYLPDRTLSRA